MSNNDDRPSGAPLSDELLVAYLDGELAAQERARVEGLLVTDPEARERLEQHRRVDAALGHLPGRGASAGFADRVQAAVRSREAAPARRLWLLRPTPLAAAAALLMAAGLWWAIGRGPGAETNVLTAQEEQEIAQDLLLLSSLDALQLADADELAEIADDLDVLDALGPEIPFADADPEDG
jgi:anti-sigma factor RsiW